jgi:uncharacterized protein YegP (UPF0339 family)
MTSFQPSYHPNLITMPAHFIIESTTAGHRFVLVANNGERIIFGKEEMSVNRCTESMRQLQKHCDKSHYQFKELVEGGAFRFTIQSDQSETLATSEAFWSEQSRDYAIQIVLRECGEARLKS